jgi:hypothetical protein
LLPARRATDRLRAARTLENDHAGLRDHAMVASFALEGAINGPMFLAYVKQCLVPTLKHGDIVVMDNLPVHNGIAQVKR